MRKRIIAMLSALLLTGVACAEVYTGVTAALTEISVCAESDGVLENVYMEAGSMTETGALLAEYRTEKVFASQDGTVAAIHFAEGDRCVGAVLEILPMQKYIIYCTAKNAYQSPESTLVHGGEQVYIKCTVNGTHRGIGVITGIDGIEYSVLTVGGEFHVGETVYLYRDAAFSTKQRIGIGTVVENDPETYESEGRIVRLHVTEGEKVERGELLYETVSGNAAEIRADIAGIVKSVNAANGETVQKGQVLAGIVPMGDVCVEIHVDETALNEFRKGMRVEVCPTADHEETFSSGTVTEISGIGDQGQYRIMIAPDATEGLKLGMTVRVRTE